MQGTWFLSLVGKIPHALWQLRRWTATTTQMPRVPALQQQKPPQKDSTHCNQREDPRTREYLCIGRKPNTAKTKETNKKPVQRDRRNPERAGSIHFTPATLPSLDFYHFPRSCRGEMRLGLSWSWVWCVYTRVLPTRITRRKRRAAERQSLLIFMDLQEGSWGCWGWTKL